MVAIITQVSTALPVRAQNYPKLDEIQWHFLRPHHDDRHLSYAMVKDSHVRVDILHMGLKDRNKRIIEILGISCFWW